MVQQTFDVDIVREFPQGQLGRMQPAVVTMLDRLGKQVGLSWMPTAGGYMLFSKYIESGQVRFTETSVSLRANLKALYRPFAKKIKTEIEKAMRQLG